MLFAKWQILELWRESSCVLSVTEKDTFLPPSSSAPHSRNKRKATAYERGKMTVWWCVIVALLVAQSDRLITPQGEIHSSIKWWTAVAGWVPRVSLSFSLSADLSACFLLTFARAPQQRCKWSKRSPTIHLEEEIWFCFPGNPEYQLGITDFLLAMEHSIIGCALYMHTCDWARCLASPWRCLRAHDCLLKHNQQFTQADCRSGEHALMICLWSVFFWRRSPKTVADSEIRA